MKRIKTAMVTNEARIIVVVYILNEQNGEPYSVIRSVHCKW